MFVKESNKQQFKDSINLLQAAPLCNHVALAMLTLHKAEKLKTFRCYIQLRNACVQPLEYNVDCLTMLTNSGA